MQQYFEADPCSTSSHCDFQPCVAVLLGTSHHRIFIGDFLGCVGSVVLRDFGVLLRGFSFRSFRGL